MDLHNLEKKEMNWRKFMDKTPINIKYKDISLKRKYLLVINEEYEKLHQELLKFKSSPLSTLWSKGKVSQTINSIEYRISFVNSKDITLRQLKEELEIVIDATRWKKNLEEI